MRTRRRASRSFAGAETQLLKLGRLAEKGKSGKA